MGALLPEAETVDVEPSKIHTVTQGAQKRFDISAARSLEFTDVKRLQTLLAHKVLQVPADVLAHSNAQVLAARAVRRYVAPAQHLAAARGVRSGLGLHLHVKKGPRKPGKVVFVLG